MADSKPPRSAIGRATTSGLAWLMAQSLATRVTAFVSQLMLAWLLMPADFGLIGLAYTVTTLVNTIVNFGLDDVLLQRQRRLHLWNSTAVWLSFALGVLGMLLLFIAAPIAEHVYDEPKLGWIIAILAIGMPIGALGTVPVVTLRAQLNFRFLASWGAFELAALQAMTILLAWQGFGAFSFAIPAPLLALLRVIVFWRMAPARITRRVRRSQARYLLSNGTLVFGNRVITELVGQGDYITLGIMATQSVVGVYYFAFRLAAQPVRMLAGNFQNVVFPAFVQMNGDPRRQNAAAVQACLTLAYLVMPLCFLQAAVADPMLRLLFGTKWLGAIPIIQILSLALPFDAVSWIAGALLHARGEFRRSFVFSAIAAPCFFAFAVAGAWLDQAVGVAVGRGLFYLILPTAYSWFIFVGYGIPGRTVARIYGRPVLLTAATVGPAWLISFAPLWGGRPIVQLFVVGIIGPLAYVAAMWLFDRAALEEIIERTGLYRLWQRVRLKLAH